MNRLCTLYLVAAVCAVAPLAYAGTLRLGAPVIENNRYTYPVLLSGGDGQVSALNFSLQYDPAVFRPVDASAGSGAQQANKLVTANMPRDGVYKVVMMGLNQETLSSGEVARVQLEHVGDPESGQSRLDIADPTLATWDGQELPSQGRSRTEEFGTKATPATPETKDPDNTADPVEDKPNAPADSGGTPASVPPGRSTGFPGTMPMPALPELEKPAVLLARAGAEAAEAPEVSPGSESGESGAGSAETASATPDALHGTAIPTPPAAREGGASVPAASLAIPGEAAGSNASGLTALDPVEAATASPVDPDAENPNQGSIRLVIAAAGSALFLLFAVFLVRFVIFR